MKRACLVTVCALAVVFSGVASAQKKPKDNFPALILHARYIYVTAFTGDQFNPRVMQEDRIAMNDVINALRKWGRYAITYNENNADLVMVVRRGKVAALKGGVILGGPNVSVGRPGVDVGVGRPGAGTGTSSGGPGVYSGAEAGSPDDTLMVMRGGEPPLDTSALWRRSAHNGLQGPNPALVQAFKKDVEQAAAKKP